MFVPCGDISVEFPSGILVAGVSQNPDYPGIDVEYACPEISDKVSSKPRVLIGFHEDEPGKLMAWIWNDPEDDSPSEEIVLFDHNHVPE